MQKHHVEDRASGAIDGAGNAASGLAKRFRGKAGNGRKRK
jgi:hypothetical protein